MFKTLTVATTSLLVLTNVTRGEEGEWPNPYPYYNDNGASSLRRQIDGDYGGSYGGGYGYTPNPLAHPAVFPALLFSAAGVSIFLIKQV